MEKCSHCNKTAVIVLGYVGKRQCREHFMEMFEKRFMRTIRENGEIKKGETVSIADGNYSKVLEYLMKKLQMRIPFTIAKNAKTVVFPYSADDIAAQTLEAFMKPAKKIQLPSVKEEHINGKRCLKPLTRAPKNEITVYAKLNGIRVRKKKKNRLGMEIDEHIEMMEKKYPGSVFKIISSLRYLKG